MFTQSIWNAYSGETAFEALDEDITVDVAIIGGGITGVTAAELLARGGRKVALLEALKLGGGTTGHSTGNLYVGVDHTLSAVSSKYGVETLRDILAARSQAVRLIARNVSEYTLDCDLTSCDWYFYSDNPESDTLIDRELEAARQAGLGVQYGDASELPFSASRVLRLRDQLQFNPKLYVQGLAHAIESASCRIYENTAVESITEGRDGICTLQTPGGTVRAEHVIHATHTPKGTMLVQTLLGPYREYGIACRLHSGMPGPGIFWGYPRAGEKYSTRSYRRGDDEFLIVVGRPHKVGQLKSNEECLHKLEQFANGHFPVAEVTHRWGGQHYRPADLLPYIGRTHEDSNILIATGFSTDGLVYGALAAGMLSDLVQGRSNRWTELFDPSRKQPLKAAKNFIKENANVFVQYLKDIPGVAVEAREFSDVAPGEGKIVEKSMQKLAVCRTLDNRLLVRSAICTHLACVVNWNGAEQTWDCPCHGSRFKPDGSVLEGPAMRPLYEIQLLEDEVHVVTPQEGEFTQRNPELF
ncbi:MAG TPA: FAD-dependent oxidoreductase [Gammaproteobacteria bacterium]|nr:FAD-dependent oxidoreductase [Gammaproteobacteria bacterium]